MEGGRVQVMGQTAGHLDGCPTQRQNLCRQAVRVSDKHFGRGGVCEFTPDSALATAGAGVGGGGVGVSWRSHGEQSAGPGHSHLGVDVVGVGAGQQVDAVLQPQGEVPQPGGDLVGSQSIQTVITCGGVPWTTAAGLDLQVTVGLPTAGMTVVRLRPQANRAPEGRRGGGGPPVLLLGIEHLQGAPGGGPAEGCRRPELFPRAGGVELGFDALAGDPVPNGVRQGRPRVRGQAQELHVGPGPAGGDLPQAELSQVEPQQEGGRPGRMAGR